MRRCTMRTCSRRRNSVMPGCRSSRKRLPRPRLGRVPSKFTSASRIRRQCQPASRTERPNCSLLRKAKSGRNSASSRSPRKRQRCPARTLRFDNLGNRPLGNITILDNLTTRLELVPGSAQCSVPAAFVVEPNDGGSDILRFEITDPIYEYIHGGGVIRTLAAKGEYLDGGSVEGWLHANNVVLGTTK